MRDRAAGRGLIKNFDWPLGAASTVAPQPGAIDLADAVLCVLFATESFSTLTIQYLTRGRVEGGIHSPWRTIDIPRDNFTGPSICPKTASRFTNGTVL